MRRCDDCGTALLRTNRFSVCRECALIRKNAKLTTPSMARRRDEMLRAAAVARRIAEMDSETPTDRREYK